MPTHYAKAVAVDWNLGHQRARIMGRGNGGTRGPGNVGSRGVAWPKRVKIVEIAGATRLGRHGD